MLQNHLGRECHPEQGLLGETLKVIVTFLEECAAIGDNDAAVVKTEHQSCRITLFCCAVSDSGFSKVTLVFFL